MPKAFSTWTWMTRRRSAQLSSNRIQVLHSILLCAADNASLLCSVHKRVSMQNSSWHTKGLSHGQRQRTRRPPATTNAGVMRSGRFRVNCDRDAAGGHPPCLDIFTVKISQCLRFNKAHVFHDDGESGRQQLMIGRLVPPVEDVLQIGVKCLPHLKTPGKNLSNFLVPELLIPRIVLC